MGTVEVILEPFVLMPSLYITHEEGPRKMNSLFTIQDSIQYCLDTNVQEN